MPTKAKVSLVRNPDGLFEEHAGAHWVRTDGDGFANSDLDCCVCGKTVDAGETAFYCLDGGEAAHVDCVRVKAQRLN